MIVTRVPTQKQQKFKTWMYVAGENWKVTLLFEHPSYRWHMCQWLVVIVLKTFSPIFYTRVRAIPLASLLVHKRMRSVHSPRFDLPPAFYCAEETAGLYSRRQEAIELVEWTRTSQSVLRSRLYRVRFTCSPSVNRLLLDRFRGTQKIQLQYHYFCSTTNLSYRKIQE